MSGLTLDDIARLEAQIAESKARLVREKAEAEQAKAEEEAKAKSEAEAKAKAEAEAKAEEKRKAEEGRKEAGSGSGSQRGDRGLQVVPFTGVPLNSGGAPAAAQTTNPAPDDDEIQIIAGPLRGTKRPAEAEGGDGGFSGVPT